MFDTVRNLRPVSSPRADEMVPWRLFAPSDLRSRQAGVRYAIKGEGKGAVARVERKGEKEQQAASDHSHSHGLQVTVCAAIRDSLSVVAAAGVASLVAAAVPALPARSIEEALERHALLRS